MKKRSRDLFKESIGKQFFLIWKNKFDILLLWKTNLIASDNGQSIFGNTSKFKNCVLAGLPKLFILVLLGTQTIVKNGSKLSPLLKYVEDLHKNYAQEKKISFEIIENSLLRHEIPYFLTNLVFNDLFCNFLAGFKTK